MVDQLVNKGTLSARDDAMRKVRNSFAVSIETTAEVAAAFAPTPSRNPIREVEEVTLINGASSQATNGASSHNLTGEATEVYDIHMPDGPHSPELPIKNQIAETNSSTKVDKSSTALAEESKQSPTAADVYGHAINPWVTDEPSHNGAARRQRFPSERKRGPNRIARRAGR